MGEPEYQRKLTFILQLTDPDEYVGGDLIVYTHKEEERMTRQQGSLIVFPSYTMHEVTELLSGTRYSLIGWVLGPEFV
jgi:predicted 2-oxoglutarate/Fe(II)-dependent dioxygenase YbiX